MRSIFLQYLNREILALYGVAADACNDAKLYAVSKLLTRYAVLLTDRTLIIPASYLFEVSWVGRLLNALRPVRSAGLIEYASPTPDLEAYSDDKEREYRNEPWLFPYGEAPPRAKEYRQLVWTPRWQRSASGDIARAWRGDLSRGGPVWEGVLRQLHKDGSYNRKLEEAINRVPDALESRAFIFRYANDLLPFNLRGNSATAVNMMINRAYLESYLLEYDANILVDTPLGMLDAEAHALRNRFISFRAWRETLRVVGLCELVESATWSEIVRIVASPNWHWFRTSVRLQQDPWRFLRTVSDHASTQRRGGCSAEAQVINRLSALRHAHEQVVRRNSAQLGSSLETHRLPEHPTLIDRGISRNVPRVQSIGGQTDILKAGDVVSGTIIFISIPGIKEAPAADAFGAMQTLHHRLKVFIPFGRVFSCLTGAIVFVPDAEGRFAHVDLHCVAETLRSIHIPVRVGVTQGDIEGLVDADGRVNAVGPQINIAARIAFAKENPGYLFHSSYVDFSKARVALPGDPLDFRIGKSISASGKPHDPAIECSLLEAFTIAESLQSFDVVEPKYIGGTVLAYDLPRFSSGDRAELSSRFRAVGDALQRMGTDLTTAAVFSPGGDGGLLVLPTRKDKALAVAERFVTLLKVEDDNRAVSSKVASRVGLHYGMVSLYENAEGILRPTGPVCFVADEVAKDLEAGTGIAITDSLVDAATEGSRALLAKRFCALAPLESGPAMGIRRFQRVSS